MVAVKDHSLLPKPLKRAEGQSVYIAKVVARQLGSYSGFIVICIRTCNSDTSFPSNVVCPYVTETLVSILKLMCSTV